MNSLPTSTIKAATKLSALDHWARRMVFRQIKNLQTGSLIIRDQLGEVDCGDSQPDRGIVRMNVGDGSLYRRMVFGGVIGAAESYMDGHWNTNDLTGLIRLMIRNLEAMQKLDRGLSWISRRVARIGFWLRKNTRTGSRRNIHEHYDLGNEFFQLFLDNTMNYSNGLFPSKQATMYEASLAKMDRICRKLNLSPRDHLLEIGTGWGGLAIYAAQHFGCHVTTTTISREQYELARQRVEQAGLQNRITVLKLDYRELSGQFNKLVSVEMIEAVGHEFYPTFFAQCDRLLTEDGVMLLQAITMNERDYEHHLRSMDFMRKYIFPGGSLPTVTALTLAAAKVSRLRLLHLEDITQHYVWTLQRWRETFLAKLDEVRALKFSESFIRKWIFYLCYCEAAFAERRTGSVQIMYAKQAARLDPLEALDQTRDAFEFSSMSNRETQSHTANDFAGAVN